MRKFVFAAVAASALLSAPAMANEGRVEARSGIAWANGNEDFIAGVAAGYDIDVDPNVFVGAEASFETNFDGAEFYNVGARLGTKLGDGKLYLTGAYEIDSEEFGVGAGYEHKLGNNVYGKIEYRRYLLNGTDLNTAGVGLGVRF